MQKRTYSSKLLHTFRNFPTEIGISNEIIATTFLRNAVLFDHKKRIKCYITLQKRNLIAKSIVSTDHKWEWYHEVIGISTSNYVELYKNNSICRERKELCDRKIVLLESCCIVIIKQCSFWKQIENNHPSSIASKIMKIVSTRARKFIAI